MSVPLPAHGGRGARNVELIEVVTAEGLGDWTDIVREVTWYYNGQGELIARRDPADGDLRYLAKMPTFEWREGDIECPVCDVTRCQACTEDGGHTYSTGCVLREVPAPIAVAAAALTGVSELVERFGIEEVTRVMEFLNTQPRTARER